MPQSFLVLHSSRENISVGVSSLRALTIPVRMQTLSLSISLQCNHISILLEASIVGKALLNTLLAKIFFRKKEGFNHLLAPLAKSQFLSESHFTVNIGQYLLIFGNYYYILAQVMAIGCHYWSERKIICPGKTDNFPHFKKGFYMNSLHQTYHHVLPSVIIHESRSNNAR